MSRSAKHALSRPDRATSDDLLGQAAEWHDPGCDPITDQGAWTVDDLKRAARYAASRSRVSPGACLDSPYLLAISGVGYAIAQDPTVSWVDAIASGQAEIWQAAAQWKHGSGLSSTGDGSPAPKYWTYWADVTKPYQPIGSGDEYAALAQVLAHLDDRHRETLTLAALTDTTQEAADIAGITTFGFLHRLQRARRAALQLWFDHEIPPDLARLPIQRRTEDRTCPQGHSITGDNIRWETKNGRRLKRCRACRLAADRRRRASKAAS